MKIESIFRKIPDFRNIVLDTVLFESRYPVLFTCKNENGLYLFICCFVTSDKSEWIGTKTTYDNLLNLLKNKITIRDAFLNITEQKVVINYDGKNVDYSVTHKENIPEKLLPSAGEFMDAEDGEYAEEIAEFEKRNKNMEYMLKPQKNVLIMFQFKEKCIYINEDDREDLDMQQYGLNKIYKQQVALV